MKGVMGVVVLVVIWSLGGFVFAEESADTLIFNGGVSTGGTVFSGADTAFTEDTTRVLQGGAEGNQAPTEGQFGLEGVGGGTVTETVLFEVLEKREGRREIREKIEGHFVEFPQSTNIVSP